MSLAFLNGKAQVVDAHVPRVHGPGPPHQSPLSQRPGPTLKPAAWFKFLLCWSIEDAAMWRPDGELAPP